MGNDEFGFLPQPFPPFSPGESRGRGDQAPLSAWEKLTNGQPLGKSTIVRYTVPGIVSVAPVFSPVNILRIQGEDKYAVPMVVQLSPPQVVRSAGLTINDPQQISTTQDNNEIYSLATPFEFVPAVAEITWGIGGGASKVEVDISNGATVNVFGSFVQVRAGVDLSWMPGGFWGATTNAFYRLSAQIAPGYARATGCKRSFAIASLLADGGFTDFFPIPRYAKRVQIFGIGAVGTVFVGKIRFTLGPANTNLVGECFVQANLPTPIMIPSGAMYYRCENNSGAQMTMYAVFELDI